MTTADTTIEQKLSSDESAVVYPALAHKIFTQHEQDVVFPFIDVLQKEIHHAQDAGVERGLLKERVSQVLFGHFYSPSVFMDNASQAPQEITEGWITQKMYAYMHDKHETIVEVGDQVITTLSQTRHGSAALALFESFERSSGSEIRYKTLRYLLPVPTSPDTQNVTYWPMPHKDTLPIGIRGYDRTGPAALRRIIGDFQRFRRLPWQQTAYYPTEVSAASWMFAREDAVETLFGEALSSLQQNGMRWIPGVDILDAKEIETVRDQNIAPVESLITAAVYAIPLKDNFLRNFLTTGTYPRVGFFRMPGETFHTTT